MSFSSKEIGRNLLELREQAGLSMDDLAQRMNERGYKWNRGTVFNVEHAERQLKLAEAADILECLGYDSRADLGRLLMTPDDAEFLRLADNLEGAIESLLRGCYEVDLALREADRQLNSTKDGGGTAAPKSAAAQRLRELTEQYDRDSVIKIAQVAISDFGIYDKSITGDVEISEHRNRNALEKRKAGWIAMNWRGGKHTKH